MMRLSLCLCDGVEGVVEVVGRLETSHLVHVGAKECLAKVSHYHMSVLLHKEKVIRVRVKRERERVCMCVCRARISNIIYDMI